MFTSMVPLQYRPTERAPAANQPAKNAPRIIDIRREKLEISLEEDILKGLGNDEGEKILPTMLLYSADGLRLFEEITYMDEYYLTNTEIELLERCADSMASRIEDGSVVLELGSGQVYSFD